MSTEIAQSNTIFQSLENKKVLGHFLRNKRENLDPIALGVITSGRRRTPGLRREEVAQLADIGTTWYTWLEQGRDIKTSSNALAAIGEALRLSKAEIHYVFHLAALPIPKENLTDVCQKISENNQLILDQLMPFPAAVQSLNFDILGFNQTFCKLLSTDIQQIPESERNCMIQLLTNPVWRNSFVNWEDSLSNLISILRATVAKNPENKRNQYLVQYCSQISDEFKRQWHCKQAVCDFENKKKIMIHPEVGEIHLIQVNWWSSTTGSGTSERLLVDLPETEEDKLKLKWISEQ